MKQAYMVEFELPDNLSPSFLELIPKQRAAVNQMLTDGTIKSYSLSLDRTKLWAIFVAESEFDVMEAVASLPLSDFMVPSISELMFHNASEVVMQFSLN